MSATYCPHCPHCQASRRSRNEGARRKKAATEGEVVFIHYRDSYGVLTDLFAPYGRPRGPQPARAVRGKKRLTVYPDDGSTPRYTTLEEWDAGNGLARLGDKFCDYWVSRSGDPKEAQTAIDIEHSRLTRERAAASRARADASRERVVEHMRARGASQAEIDDFLRIFNPEHGTPQDIAALRRKVQDSHPDRGGDPEAFHRAKRELDRARGRA